jgi:hypothetical protein
LANLSISVGGGQQGWLAFALRRHVRIVSDAPENQQLGLVALMWVKVKVTKINPALAQNPRRSRQFLTRARLRDVFIWFGDRSLLLTADLGLIRIPELLSSVAG